MASTLHSSLFLSFLSLALVFFLLATTLINTTNSTDTVAADVGGGKCHKNFLLKHLILIQMPFN